MIIACEKCSTRFQLDAARVPATGVKVRCSRCRHAFVVRPAEAELATGAEAEAVHAHEAAARAARARKPPASEDRTQALAPERSGERGTQAGRPHAEGAAESDEESDWQFAEDLAAGEAEAEERSRAAAAAPAPDPVRDLFQDPASPAPADPALEEVGSPEDWNLLGSEAPPAAPDPLHARTAPRQERAAAQTPSTLPAPSLLAPAVTPRERAASAAGWLAVSVLVAAAAWAALVPPAPRVSVAQARPIALAGLELAEARGRMVENAVGAGLLVVTARLSNPGSEPRLAEAPLGVRLVAADGTPIGDASPVAQVQAPSRLRGDAPEALAEEQRRGGLALAQTPFAPGASVEVAAILPAPPPEARGFRFELLPRPALSSEASPPPSLPSSE